MILEELGSGGREGSMVPLFVPNQVERSTFLTESKANAYPGF
jgi:hypothetical protein